MHTYHTPGPWTAVMAYGYKIRAADGTTIASLPTHCPLTYQDPANAYLVAAAPDLLAACCAILDELDDQLVIEDHIRKMLHNAITKATGHRNGNGQWSFGREWQIESR